MSMGVPPFDPMGSFLRLCKEIVPEKGALFSGMGSGAEGVRRGIANAYKFAQAAIEKQMERSCRGKDLSDGKVVKILAEGSQKLADVEQAFDQAVASLSPAVVGSVEVSVVESASGKPIYAFRRMYLDLIKEFDSLKKKPISEANHLPFSHLLKKCASLLTFIENERLFRIIPSKQLNAVMTATRYLQEQISHFNGFIYCDDFIEWTDLKVVVEFISTCKELSRSLPPAAASDLYRKVSYQYGDAISAVRRNSERKLTLLGNPRRKNLSDPACIKIDSEEAKHLANIKSTYDNALAVLLKADPSILGGESRPLSLATARIPIQAYPELENRFFDTIEPVLERFSQQTIINPQSLPLFLEFRKMCENLLKDIEKVPKETIGRTLMLIKKELVQALHWLDDELIPQLKNAQTEQ